MLRTTADAPRNYSLPPTRAAKRLLDFPVDVTQLAFDGRRGGGRAGQDYTLAKGVKDLQSSDFTQTQAIGTGLLAAGLTDFIYISLPDRGPNKSELVFKFLINPDNISASRQVVDGEALTRAGLQTGIWGDLLDISVSGVTAGQYFAGSLVDGHSQYSQSNRNLMELVSIYENNGCWFEGEARGAVASSSDVARKQIQLHADVTLAFGNFVWSGCFTDLSVDESADTPHYSKFSFNFMAWRERFKADSPWRNSIRNENYYGHAYEVFKAKGKDLPAGVDNTLISGAGGGLMDAAHNQLSHEVQPSALPKYVQQKMM